MFLHNLVTTSKGLYSRILAAAIFDCKDRSNKYVNVLKVLCKVHINRNNGK